MEIYKIIIESKNYKKIFSVSIIKNNIDEYRKIIISAWSWIFQEKVKVYFYFNEKSTDIKIKL